MSETSTGTIAGTRSPEQLHRSLDVLIADYADAHSGSDIAHTTVYELACWSNKRSLQRTREAIRFDDLYAAIAITADGRAVLLRNDTPRRFDIRANLDGALVMARDSVHRPAPPTEECGPPMVASEPAQHIGSTIKDIQEHATMVFAVDRAGTVIVLKNRVEAPFAPGTTIGIDTLHQMVTRQRYP